MSDDSIVRFPARRTSRHLGAPAMAATFESELDPANPSTDSLRALLKKRLELVEQYGSSDGSVREVEHDIAEKVMRLAGFFK